MRVIGLLSWYAERPSWLAGCITSYAQAGITHLVAIDGAYAMFPDAQPRSQSVEHDTILETCRGLGLHLTLISPHNPWQGNEIEKRSALFRYAEAIAQPNVDWYLIIDADELVTRALAGWTDLLARTEHDTADVLLTETEPRDTQPKAQVDRLRAIDPTTASPIRKLFRAIPGLHVTGNHYTYRTPDGRDLWSDPPLREPGVDLTEHVHIDHRSKYRSLHRHAAAHAYYTRRDEAGIETQLRVAERDTQRA